MPHPYRHADAQHFRQLAQRCWRAGTAAYFAIEHRGRYSGTMDLRLESWPARTAEVGYSVAPWARGHGVATAALRRPCAWAFDELALERIEWRAQVGNHASRRTAERAGFRVEGTERARILHRGTPLDTWYGRPAAS